MIVLGIGLTGIVVVEVQSYSPNHIGSVDEHNPIDPAEQYDDKQETLEEKEKIETEINQQMEDEKKDIAMEVGKIDEEDHITTEVPVPTLPPQTSAEDKKTKLKNGTVLFDFLPFSTTKDCETDWSDTSKWKCKLLGQHNKEKNNYWGFVSSASEDQFTPVMKTFCTWIHTKATASDLGADWIEVVESEILGS